MKNHRPGSAHSPGRVVAMALAALLGGAGVVATAVPASAAVVGLQLQDDGRLTWSCSPNEKGKASKSHYGIDTYAALGTIDGPGPYEVDASDLTAGSHWVYVRCHHQGMAGYYPGQLYFQVEAAVTAPSAPLNVKAEPAGPGRVQLSWAPPVDDGGEAVTYTVTRNPGDVLTSGITGTSLVVDELTNDTPYTFTVTAANSVGKAVSAPVTTTPQRAASTVEVTTADGPVMGSTSTFVAEVTAGQALVDGGVVSFAVTGSDEVHVVPVSDKYAAADVTLPMRAGDITVTASFSGTKDVAPSSGTWTYQFDAATPVVTLQPVPEQVVTGDSFTVSAAVTGEYGTPEGGVQFIAYRSDSKDSVAVDATLVDGGATGTFNSLPVGTWNVLAHYSGSATQGVYAQADSTEQELVVVAAPVVLGVPTSVTTPVATAANLPVDFGDGLRPETLTVSSGDEVLVTVDVPSFGPATVALPVLPPGTHTLTVATAATDSVLAAQATVELTVVGEPERFSEAPDVELRGSVTPAPGDTVTVTGERFFPGETVAFFLQPDDVLLDTAVADQDGVVSAEVEVPADLAVGKHGIRATGGSSGHWGVLEFTVAAPLPPVELPVPVTPPATLPQVGQQPAPVTKQSAAAAAAAAGTVSASALPRTGTDTTGLLALAAAMIAAGAGMLRVRRSREN